MKKFIAFLLSFSIILSGCSSKEETSSISEDTSNDFTEVNTLLLEDYFNLDFEYTYSIASDNFKSALSMEDLKSAIVSTLEPLGSCIELEETKTSKNGDLTAIINYLKYENTGILIIFSFNADGILEGYNINFYQPETTEETTLPNGIIEEDFTVVTGEYSLPAKLTSSEETENKSVILLVHGSGPNDMNETVFGTKIFEDIAYSMPLMGVDVFRYDKRTNVYKQNISPNGDEYFTAYDEVIADALSAAKILNELGYENVYLVGHSLGAILGPRIINEDPSLFAGFISLAGSPKTITDILINQNNMMISALAKDEQTLAQALVDTEIEKLKNLENFSEEELLSTTIFQQPAYYVKDFNSYDTLALAKNLDIPMLFLQGSEDFQVTVEHDFNAWQEGLQGHSNAQFILYDGLTHLFTKTPENPTNTVSDYMFKASIEKEVVEDMVSFIKENE